MSTIGPEQKLGSFFYRQPFTIWYHDLMDREITENIELLKADGTLTEQGWARRMLFNYDRKKIKAPFYRIKEWDYYAFLNPEKGYAIAATFSDLGYAGLFAITYVDLNLKKSVQMDSIKFLSRHKTGLAPSSVIDSEVSYHDEKLTIAFVKKGKCRNLLFTAPQLVLPSGDVGLKCELSMIESSKKDSINIATSFVENRKAFYLNQKIVGMPTTGIIRRGANKEEIAKGEAFGILDWGRGRWTYKNTWYWGSAAGCENGINLGLNLGYGFSDRTEATENALFIENTLYKVHNINFEISEDFMKPWKMRDDKGMVELDFIPVVPRTSYIKIGPITSDQKQYFGYYTGVIRPQGMEEIKVERLYGFAEKVYNAY